MMLRRAHLELEEALDRILEAPRPALSQREQGRVSSLEGGVVRMTGFTAIGHEELISLPGGVLALAADITAASVGGILLGSEDNVRVGDLVLRTHERASVPVGQGLCGRVVDSLGRPLDGRGPVPDLDHSLIDRAAPPILSRAPVRRPLLTGIKSIDAAVPIGRGQRELILGDRQTGKTSIAVDTILNQGDDVISVYCAIGQRQSAVSRVIEALTAGDALWRTIIVVASGDGPTGLQYLAPYAATAMAEHFRDRGHDALIVYDDLTRHARAYRELSLLLRRPPGREAYPGDIFYLHARLLERATQLRVSSGGGSLTALPIVETQAGQLSDYIPTNLISITDGQIYVSADLFEEGHLPAVDIGQSVSRVGGKAQFAAYRAVTGALKLYYAQFEELEAFSRFGTRLEPETLQRLERGRRMREVLKQAEHAPLSPKEQMAILIAVTDGLLDRFPLDQIALAEAELVIAAQRPGSIWQDFHPAADLDEETRRKLVDALRGALAQGFPQEVEDGTV